MRVPLLSEGVGQPNVEPIVAIPLMARTTVLLTTAAGLRPLRAVASLAEAAVPVRRQEVAVPVQVVAAVAVVAEDNDICTNKN